MSETPDKVVRSDAEWRTLLTQEHTSAAPEGHERPSPAR